ncbi:OmpA family protein [Amycolatopsis saalfeldensis]|uniref:Outer membrane protein OmpA n=1 Tax=Amycolatopsis saalfeldensis TaxID=394193 RepID=A0A1H8WFX0_9PSEU|nr:OmpA family protein [Amycolatopsis saalfeldensis]SEP26540.1 Outer membrane protein OmpA [Amycolatopsis saalfeldensis]
MSGARGWLRLIPLAVVVTALLAGLATWVSGSGIESGLGERSRSALTAAGITGGDVTFSGREATLSGFPAEQAGRALGIVRGVDGVQSAQVSGGGTPSTPAPSPSSAPPTTSAPPSPSATPTPPPAPPTDRAGMQDALDKQLASTPVTFKPDSAQLTDEGDQAARGIAKLLSAAPDSLRYRITGHVADGPGGRTAALKLAQNRARTVVRLLTDEGVPANRLLARGTSVTAPGGGSGGDDRRVEITVEER